MQNTTNRANGLLLACALGVIVDEVVNRLEAIWVLLKVHCNSSFLLPEDVVPILLSTSDGQHIGPLVSCILLTFAHKEIPFVLQHFDDIFTRQLKLKAKNYSEQNDHKCALTRPW